MTKHLTLYVFFFLNLLFTTSCESDKDRSIGAEELVGVPFARTNGLDTTLVIVQETNDHRTLKNKMEELSDDWKAKGVKSHTMFLSASEDNKVVTFMALNDYEKASTLIKDETQMQSLNISGEGSEVMMLDQELEYTKETNDTVLFLMGFKTMNYERWEKAFLEDFKEDPSKDFEVLKVFRGVEEPNQVYMFFLVDDPQYVQKMEKDNGFRMKMLAAGVVSYPVTYMLLSDSV